MAARPSWADIPDNILVNVSAFLRCRADRVHMESVNLHWKRAVRGVGRPEPPVLPPLPPLPPQLPWLIFPSTEAPTFYSPVGGHHHRLCRLPPDVRRARCCGSGEGGWLVLVLDSSHTHALYNLNSGLRIPLPPSFTTPEGKEFPLVVRVATISAPPSPNPYMVAAIVLMADLSTAAFWSEASARWFSAGALLGARPQDVIYHRGAFFFVTSCEEVVSFRPADGWNSSVNQLARVDYDMQRRADYADDIGFVEGMGLGAMRRYLVESRGRLFMVVRYIYNQSGRTEAIRVFEFRVMGPAAVLPWQQPRAAWEHLGTQLDGRMLFLGPGCSRSFEVAHYNGSAEGEFEESMINFLDDGLVSVPSGGSHRRLYSFTDKGRYSLANMATEQWPPVLCPTRSDNAPQTWWLH